MDTKKLGRQTVRLTSPPSIAGFGSAVGKKEGQGPLGRCFDFASQDDSFAEKSWEKAEAAMQKQALSYALDKAGISSDQLDYVFAGDLLNQCIATSYSLRAQNAPFFGLYGACSTMAEGMSLAAMLVDGGFASYAAALTSSHFCSAERQYRNPWSTVGKSRPLHNGPPQGPARSFCPAKEPVPLLPMSPQAKLWTRGLPTPTTWGPPWPPPPTPHSTPILRKPDAPPDFYDLIVTGDLGSLGKEIVTDFFQRDGIDLRGRYDDCGVLLFDPTTQDVHAGGSGCGCSAVVLTGHLLREMRRGTYRNLLFCGTGALHSPTATMQGRASLESVMPWPSPRRKEVRHE